MSLLGYLENGLALSNRKYAEENWQELSGSIKQENSLQENLIKENTDLTDLEQLVQIVKGTTLNDLNAQRNFYMIELEKTMSWWDKEIKTFIEKQNECIKKIQSLIKLQLVYEWKEDWYQILASVKEIDKSIFSAIIEMFKKKKISGCLRLLQKNDTRKLYKQYNLNCIQFITNVLQNINDHGFNQFDYSAEGFQETIDL